MPSTDLARQIIDSGAQFVIGTQPDNPSWGRGVPNPFGNKASAWEPNTQIYTPGTDPLMAGSSAQLTGQGAFEKQKADEAAKAASSAAAGAASANAGGPMINAQGTALAFINAAKSQLGVPYVWGGTTPQGFDCSGLVYWAFNQAGIKMPRYTADGYARMGQEVTAQDARPGDLVAWWEGNEFGHIGIYLGNGKVLNAPHSGASVEIDNVWGTPVYRRVVNDANFAPTSTPTGQPGLGYSGVPVGTLFSDPQPRVPAGLGIQTTTPGLERLPTNGYKTRAI